MSVVEEYNKLKAQLVELGGKAKDEALENIKAALETLKGLGHEYHVVEGSRGGTVGNGKTAGKRRSGIREQVLAVVKEHGPASRAQILERMNAKGDKSAQQSVSNALAALKKTGLISQQGNQYKG